MLAKYKPQFTQLARRSYHKVVPVLRRFLSDDQVQRFVLFCDRLKYRYFREMVVVPAAHSGVMPPRMPNWIIDELKELSAIEPALYPTPEMLGGFHTWYPPADPYPAVLYKGFLHDFVESAPQVIFLIPHMMRGGADLGTLHHVQFCIDRGLRVTVVLTRDVQSPWVNRFPAQVRVVEFGQLTRLASEEDRRLVLLRLLLQSPAQTIHLINSQLGWQIFEQFGKPLVSIGKKLFASVYCDDMDRNGVRCGYATDYLPRTWMHLEGVFSDNRTFLEEIRQRDGLPGERLHALYFPADIACMRQPVRGKRVLWAGRIATQKRPELLYDIARAMPDVYFDVHGEPDPYYDMDVLQRLGSLANVAMHGRFDDFAELTGNGRHALFLYTSRYDGLPNVLLEATLAGLPVVAATVGGIGELLSEKTGFPLDAKAGPLAYVEAIRRVLDNPAQAHERVASAQALLRLQHSWESFDRDTAAIAGYLPQDLSR
ncbi:sugar transferase, PEP-CTERM/EpsH1 system associated [compost metagenome]